MTEMRALGSNQVYLIKGIRCATWFQSLSDSDYTLPDCTPLDCANATGFQPLSDGDYTLPDCTPLDCANAAEFTRRAEDVYQSLAYGRGVVDG
jgi:hypothetical protein